MGMFNYVCGLLTCMDSFLGLIILTLIICGTLITMVGLYFLCRYRLACDTETIRQRGISARASRGGSGRADIGEVRDLNGLISVVMQNPDLLNSIVSLIKPAITGSRDGASTQSNFSVIE
jgi:hypothetical protein